MKNVFKLAAGVASTAVLLGLSAGAQAQAYPDVSWNINVGSGGPVYAPAPVYRQPPVVVAPAPVYYPPPAVVVQPRPVVMAPRPVVVAPAPVYYSPGYGYPGWRYGHRHEEWRRWGYGPGRGYDRDHDHGHGRR